MHTNELSSSLARLFAELVNGAPQGGDAFILNSGDAGLLRSLGKLSAADVSQSVNEGATIAAHARHLQYSLSLMNRWGREGGNPFADATWDQAWKTTRVDDSEWRSIRDGLQQETSRWLAWIAARCFRGGAGGNDRQRRASGVSPRRDQTDREGRARSQRRDVPLNGPAGISRRTKSPGSIVVGQICAGRSEMA
jgi:hypothetical protein